MINRVGAYRSVTGDYSCYRGRRSEHGNMVNLGTDDLGRVK